MWIAKYKDGTEIKQFDSDVENLFSSIDQSKLKTFAVITGQHYVILDIETGTFNINRTLINYGFKDLVYRLIYFRRVTKSLGNVNNNTTKEFIGWQSTIKDENNKDKNVKVIIEVDEILKFKIE